MKNTKKYFEKDSENLSELENLRDLSEMEALNETSNKRK